MHTQFTLAERTQQSTLGIDVHEILVVGSLHDVCTTTRERAISSTNAEFALILALLLQMITKKNLTYLMNLCREQYK